jgi:hypothetical protein
MDTMTLEITHRAMRIACKVVLTYGEGDEHEHMAAFGGQLWNDHPAVQSAQLALNECATEIGLLREALCTIADYARLPMIIA